MVRHLSKGFSVNWQTEADTSESEQLVCDHTAAVDGICNVDAVAGTWQCQAEILGGTESEKTSCYCTEKKSRMRLM